MSQWEGVEEDTRRVQVVQLNERSRMYASRLWQIPFAYLGLTGAAFIGSLAKDDGVRQAVLFGSSVFGVLVLIQMAGLWNGVHRSVTSLCSLEKSLGISEPTAKQMGLWYSLPMVMVVFVAVGFYFYQGIHLIDADSEVIFRRGVNDLLLAGGATMILIGEILTRRLLPGHSTPVAGRGQFRPKDRVGWFAKHVGEWLVWLGLAATIYVAFAAGA